ncbi:PH domain-containing protein [Actinomyces sp. zg328]|uniref:PH domain-containing protein n=1 Tax=Actinomyces sp. zg328 TaxID=2609287 RepID=UPI0013579D08|nr:PH domain-containing protein [Actinomyces sp. zg328]
MITVPTVIIRPRFGCPLTLLVAGLGAALAVTIGINDGARPLLIALACALAATAAAYALWWQPELRLDERGLTVRNLLATHRVGWGAYQRCGGRWGLEIITCDGARVPVSAAPRQGGLSIGVNRQIERSRAAVGERPAPAGGEGLLPGAGGRGLDGAHGRGRPIVLALTAERAADLIEAYRARLESAGVTGAGGDSGAAASSCERAARRNPGAIAVISIAAIAVVVAVTLVLV